MSETVVAKASPTVTAAGPATGTAGTAITATTISSVLAASSGANATGTITFTVFGPQATAPTTCTTGGTTVGTGHRLAATPPTTSSAGYTPTARRQLLVVRLLRRRHQQQRGDLDLWLGGDVRFRTVVAKASPTLTATGPATGTAGTAIAATSISSALAASSGSNATGTITFKVFGPRRTAPTTCTTGGTTVGTGTTVDRQRHLQPVGRLHADGRRQLLVVRRPTAATPTTARRPRPAAPGCPRR